MAPHLEDSATPVPTQTRGHHLLNRSFAIPGPHVVESAVGSNLHLANGQTVIDACSGAAVTNIGHGNTDILDAVIQQAQKVSYVHAHSYTTAVAEDLADYILDGTPYGLEKALFVSSGSEAIEAALKLARQYHFERGDSQRLHLVARRQGFHGNTMGSLSVSSNLARKVPYHGFAYPHVSFVTPPFAYRYMADCESEADFTQRLLRELEDEFLRVGPDTVIAFVAETVIGATAGCVVPPRGYLAGVKAVCDKYGVLLILDEVMCGTGRTGTFFAFEQEDVVPDIVTAAKGLAGGYAPIAAMYVHGRVIDALRRGRGILNHGHTYQAHPIACAAALAVQKTLRRDDLLNRCRASGTLLEGLLRSHLARCASVGDIRGRGLFWAVELVQDVSTKRPFAPAVKFADKVADAALERGVAVYPGSGTFDGVNGDHVLLAPPYTVLEDELVAICERLGEAICAQESLYL